MLHEVKQQKQYFWVRGLAIFCVFFVSLALYAKTPLHNDVIERIVTQRLSTPDPLFLRINQFLDQSVALTKSRVMSQAQSEEKAVSSARKPSTNKMLVDAQSEEWRVLRDELQSRLDIYRQKISASGSSKGLKRWDALASKIQGRFSSIEQLFLPSSKILDANQQITAMQALKRSFQTMQMHLLDNGLLLDQTKPTTSTERVQPPQILKTTNKLPVYLSHVNQSSKLPMLNFSFFNQAMAAVINENNGPPALPTEASSCGSTAEINAALATTQEVVIDQEIADLAKRLHYSPARMLEYVYHNIKFEPYYGSLKGAKGALVSGAANDSDQASLLIALLRASNIPARYVKGLVEVNDVTADPLGGRVASWLGAKSYLAASLILQIGQYPSVQSNAAGVSFPHVWVEACIPYDNYRGSGDDTSGFRWLPLDASFKDKTYQSGIAVSVDFDFDAYLAARTFETPHEQLEDQVSAYIKTQGIEPHGLNNTLLDVPYQGDIKPFKVDIIPASLPYEVVAFLAWNGSSSSEVNQLPDSHRYKLELAFSDNIDTPLFTSSLSLPDMLLGRLTLAFEGATAADQSALMNWQSDGSLPTTPTVIPCSVNVVPVLKGMVAGVEGQVIAAGSTATPLGICTHSHKLVMRVSLAELAAPDIITRTFTGINAADYHALQVYGFQSSERLLQERASKLLNSVRSYEDPNSNLDETEGEFLHFVGLKYMHDVAVANRRIGQLTNGTGQTGISVGMTVAEMKVDYVFDIPFAVARNGYFIDMPGLVSRNLDLDTGSGNYNNFLISGYEASVLEHSIWQENTRLDAISTIRGLQFTSEQGIPRITLDSSSWDTTIATWDVNAGNLIDATLNYSQDILDSIKANYIDEGFTVTMPEKLVHYGDWVGNVFIAEYNGMPLGEPSIGAYIIGKHSGGHTLRPNGDTAITAVPLTTYNTSSKTGYSIPDPSTVYNVVPPVGTGAQPLITNSGPINNGYDANFTVFSGNVNPANGNMVHAEQDISVPFSQDVSFNFTRMYNSRNPQDGPLGFGWTHSYNQTIEFIDSNSNLVSDSNDTDGLTSSISWQDSTGGQKLFKVNGSASGVPIGAFFSRVPGVYSTMQRNADGTYAIREKNGLTYIFENVSGVLGDVARLISIRDRNSNSLILKYDASCNNNLCSVTDDTLRDLLFSYDASNRITQISDWTGRLFQYKYEDGNGNLTSYHNPLAVVGEQQAVTYQYFDASDGLYLNHVLNKHTKARGNSTTYEYYANNRIFRKTDALGGKIVFRYNDFRRETTEINQRGFSKVYRHDQYGNLAELIQEDGASIRYTYDTSNEQNVYNRIALQSPEGYITQYAYDNNGNVTAITNPSGSTIESSHYNAFSQPGLIKDPNGNYVVNQFDGNGNLLQSVSLKNSYCLSNDCSSLNPFSYTPAATDMVSWNVYDYNCYGNVVEKKQVRDFAAQAVSPTAVSETGPRMSYSYDNNGLFLTGITRTGKFNQDAAVSSQSASIIYDSLGRLLAGPDGNWYAQSFNYDASGRLVRRTDRNGQSRDFDYDGNDNRVAEKLVVGSELIDSRYAEFDLLDRRIKSVNAGGAVMLFDYDKASNLTRITEPDGGVTHYDFNSLNVVTNTYNPLGYYSSRHTDASRRLRKSTNQNGLAVNYDYYAASGDGRLQKVTGALGHSIVNSYDANGNVIEKINVGSDTVTTRSTVTHYDEQNRRVRQLGPIYSDALLGSVRPVNTFTYDALGNLTQVYAGHSPDLTGSDTTQDVVALQTTFAYDDFNRRIKETDALGREWNYSFDTNNNVANTQDPENQLTAYTWGYGGQLLSSTDNNGAQYRYTRNPLGQVKTAESPHVSYQYAYDTSQRLSAIADNRNNKTLNYNYSPGGKLNSLIDSDGNRTDYLYDIAGNLTGIWAANFDFIGFNYDRAGRMTNKWMFNGVNTAYNYNDDNTLASMTNRSGVLPVSNHAYTYDVLANRSAQAETINGSTINYVYSYDELNRLIQVDNGTAAEQQAYEYDPLNNRTFKRIGTAEQAYVYDAANQLQEVRNSTPAGALLADLNYDLNGNLTGRTDTNASYIYDARDQMVQVNIPSELSQFYNYDDSGRRISKTIGTLATQYLYNGDTLINEYDGLTGDSQAYYTHGVRLDEVLISETPSQTYYYHSDALNSVVSATDASGIAQSTAQFDAWGNALAATGAAQHFGYTGREPDETGLIYYRARYYDAELGRFTQRDPIGLSGGVNRYAYTLNNPVNFTDPFGLDTELYIVYTSAESSGQDLPAQHTLIVFADTESNQVWATRGGPENSPKNTEGVSVGVDSSGLGFGQLYAETDIFNKDFADKPRDIIGVDQFAVTIDRDFSEVIANAQEFQNAVNNQNGGIDYNPIGINSNSYAFTFFESVTGYRYLFPNTIKWEKNGVSVGLGPRGFELSLDVDLTYSPAPIIAGGAFTVGDIFE